MKEKKTKIAVVIDDDIVHLACVKRELMVLGYTVFLANDGSVALENLSNYGEMLTYLSSIIICRKQMAL
ncbi:MAG: hypothetical protein SFW07_05160 [Gammaproteobacteria bacterium]|nr:hypothetical protein [Gammaproteobacteria bacterium]